jgi:hypothetical protein
VAVEQEKEGNQSETLGSLSPRNLAQEKEGKKPLDTLSIRRLKIEAQGDAECSVGKHQIASIYLCANIYVPSACMIFYTDLGV